MIGGRPEAAQVVGDLDRPIVRPEEVQQDRNAAACHAWRFGPAEQLLEPRRQDRRPPGFINQADLAAAGNRERLRGALLQLADLCWSEPALQGTG